MATRARRILEALDPIYETFGGEAKTVTLTGDRDDRWLALRPDGIRMAWPFSADKGAAFADDCARFLDNCVLVRCEAGDHLELTMDLPPAKALADFCDQIFRKVFHQGQDGPLAVEID